MRRQNVELTKEEQVAGTVRAARDSVWVVTDALGKLANGAAPSEEIKSAIERNVGHLKLVVANPDVVELGGDISDLTAAIAAGEAKLAENIWE